jgi:hypothetical protein
MRSIRVSSGDAIDSLEVIRILQLKFYVERCKRTPVEPAPARRAFMAWLRFFAVCWQILDTRRGRAPARSTFLARAGCAATTLICRTCGIAQHRAEETLVVFEAVLERGAHGGVTILPTVSVGETELTDPELVAPVAWEAAARFVYVSLRCTLSRRSVAGCELLLGSADGFSAVFGAACRDREQCGRNDQQLCNSHLHSSPAALGRFRHHGIEKFGRNATELIRTIHRGQVAAVG